MAESYRGGAKAVVAATGGTSTMGTIGGGAAASEDAPAPASPVAAEQDSLHALVLTSLDDDQAQEVVSIPLEGKTAIADHMVIASGRSTRQVTAMAQKLAERQQRVQAPRKAVCHDQRRSARQRITVREMKVGASGWAIRLRIPSPRKRLRSKAVAVLCQEDA